MISELQKEFHSKAFQLFIEKFKEMLKTARDGLEVVQDEKEFYRLQGDARTLKRLLQLQEKRETKYTQQDGGFGER